MADDGITEYQGQRIIQLLEQIVSELELIKLNTNNTEAQLTSIERDVSSIDMQMGQ
jgi:hypothetical protein